MSTSFVLYPLRVSLFSTDDGCVVIEFSDTKAESDGRSTAYALSNKTALRLAKAINNLKDNKLRSEIVMN